ncbi:chromate transporter [Bittarella massiliensis]|uniref:chromate transporter n=1 Tax=Bittarella massiliensis (ex Durand et al. 2017) TaxID=1720313 RepID=UPI00163C1BDB|nr:chromate transporter [Bittarella massiliensis (ex Durand et al. 2017)]MBC2870783.1 chromate transporter [Bittarella massiliensis (ex Durand et al. 2017)]
MIFLKQRTRTYAWLFGVNLFISAFTFGGGYIVVPMVRRYFVQKKRCFTEEELMSMAAIAQSSPGAIAINLSALAGYQVAGLGGVLVSCVAAILPPLLILGAVSAFYRVFIANAVVAAVLKGMEAGVAALMVDLIVDMCAMIVKEKSAFLTAMIPVAFLANFVFQIGAVYVLLACCLLCIARAVWKRRGVQ